MKLENCRFEKETVFPVISQEGERRTDRRLEAWEI